MGRWLQRVMRTPHVAARWRSFLFGNGHAELVIRSPLAGGAAIKPKSAVTARTNREVTETRGRPSARPPTAPLGDRSKRRHRGPSAYGLDPWGAVLGVGIDC